MRWHGKRIPCWSALGRGDGLADAHGERERVPLYGAKEDHAKAMEQAGLEVAGTLDHLLMQVDAVIDCTPESSAP